MIGRHENVRSLHPVSVNAVVLVGFLCGGGEG
jgi:hypothetical protein